MWKLILAVAKRIPKWAVHKKSPVKSLWRMSAGTFSKKKWVNGLIASIDFNRFGSKYNLIRPLLKVDWIETALKRSGKNLDHILPRGHVFPKYRRGFAVAKKGFKEITFGKGDTAQLRYDWKDDSFFKWYTKKVAGNNFIDYLLSPTVAPLKQQKKQIQRMGAQLMKPMNTYKTQGLEKALMETLDLFVSTLNDPALNTVSEVRQVLARMRTKPKKQ